MLHSDQIQHLEQRFRISSQSPQQSSSFQHVQELLNPNTCRDYLNRITEKFHTDSLVVTASQFSKRYSFMLVLPTLYAMSVYNKGLNVSPENCYIQSYDENHLWLPRLALTDWQVDQPEDDRTIWRERLLKQLFTGNIKKIWDVLHQCTGISLLVLWENMVIYINWLYKQLLQQAEQIDQVQDDFHFLLDPANQSLFNETFQPLHRFASKDGFRKTCCLHFLTSQKKDLCGGCPRRRIRRIRPMVLS